MTAFASQTVTREMASCTEAGNLLFSEQRKCVQLKELNCSLSSIVSDSVRVAELTTTKGPVATAIQVFWWCDPTFIDAMQTNSTQG
jgi:hypothetical protein